MGEWILVFMMFAVAIGSAYVVLFVARTLIRIFLPKKMIDDKRIHNRMLLVVSTFLAALLVLLTYKQVVDIVLLYK